MKKEIMLVLKYDNKTIVKTYFDTLVPNIDDNILLNETEIFHINKRLLSTETDRVILIGYIQ